MTRPDEAMPPVGPARVTQRDIAAHLGVSHVAVSLALRNRPRISGALREKVLKAAEELGYRPDPMLAALNTYRRERTSRSIQAGLAWISWWREPSAMHGWSELEAYWTAAKEVAERHGYHLYEFCPDAKDSLAAVQRVLVARNIEGVLISPPDKRLVNKMPVMDWSRFAVVRFGHGLADLPFHMVTSAQAANASMGMQRIRERGYRRVGWVSSVYSRRFGQMLNGILRANDDLPDQDRVPPLSLPEIAEVEDRELLSSWLKQHRPDAIFTNLSTLRAKLGALGVSVPKDLGLAVTSVTDCDADAGIDQNPLEIGRTGCEMLISLLTNGHRGVPEARREVFVEGRWVDGATLPRRRAETRKR